MLPTSRKLHDLLDSESLSDLSSQGVHLLVAVSGGADSVALLRALHSYSSLCVLGLLQLSAVHVNHNLRPESRDEAEFVNQLCHSLGVPVQTIKLDLESKPGGVSPEEHWRRHRYNAFKFAMSETGAQYLALGHNLDDLAETFIYHLVRGTGIHGLSFSFYKEAGTLAIIRPLWKTPRNDIEAALKTIGQPFITDPSNSDIRYSRNRIRHEVMPVLNSLNPQAAAAIFRASQAISSHFSRTSPDSDSQPIEQVSVEHLLKNPDQAATHLYNFITDATKQPPTDRQVSQAVSMVKASKTGTVALGKNQTLVVTQTILWIAPVDQPADFELAVNHCKKFGTVAMKLENPVELASAPQALTTLAETKLKVRSDTEVILRNRLPGDKINSTKLNKLLIEHKIPWYLRDYLIIAVHNAIILQVLGDYGAINSVFQRKQGYQLPVHIEKLTLA